MRSTLINLAKLYNVVAVGLAFYFASSYFVAVFLIAIISILAIFSLGAKPEENPLSLSLSFSTYASIAVIAMAIAHFFSVTYNALDRQYWQTLTGTVPQSPTELVFSQTKNSTSSDEFLVLNGKRFRCLETLGNHSSCPKAYPLAGRIATVSYAEDYPYGYIVYEMRVDNKAIYSIDDYNLGVQAIDNERTREDKWLFLLFVLPAIVIYIFKKLIALKK